MMLLVPALDTEWLVSFAKQLNRISLLTFLAPALIGIWRWHLLDRMHRGIVWFALIPGCLLNTLSEVARLLWHNNLIFNYLIIWSETLVLSFIFYQGIHSSRIRALLLWGCIVFILVAGFEYIYLGGTFGAHTYTRALQSILLIGAALAYFEQILQELNNIQLPKDPIFLLSIGVVLYYAGTLMVFILEDSMQRQHQTNQIWIMYIIQFTMLIILNVLLTMALWYANRPKAETQAPQIY